MNLGDKEFDKGKILLTKKVQDNLRILYASASRPGLFVEPAIEFYYEKLPLIDSLLYSTYLYDWSIYRLGGFKRKPVEIRYVSRGELLLNQDVLKSIVEQMILESSNFLSPDNFMDVDLENLQWMSKDGRVGLYLKEGLLKDYEIFRILSLSLMFLHQMIDFNIFIQEVTVIIQRKGNYVVEQTYSERKYVLLTLVKGTSD